VVSMESQRHHFFNFPFPMHICSCTIAWPSPPARVSAAAPLQRKGCSTAPAGWWVRRRTPRPLPVESTVAWCNILMTAATPTHHVNARHGTCPHRVMRLLAHHCPCRRAHHRCEILMLCGCFFPLPVITYLSSAWGRQWAKQPRRWAEVGTCLSRSASKPTQPEMRWVFVHTRQAVLGLLHSPSLAIPPMQTAKHFQTSLHKHV
jgi:hypothetical protein